MSPPLTTDPETLDALLAALRLSLALGENGRSDAERLAGIAELDGLAECAERHQVGGLLSHGAQRIGADGSDVPLRALTAKLRAGRAQTVRRGMRQLGELSQLAAALREREVRFLVLKGLPLAQRLYGDPFVRPAADIDLLVAPESFADARRAVLARGFRTAMPIDETPTRRRWMQRVKKEEVYVRRGVCLELHRRALANPYYFDVRFAELYERRATVAIGADRYPTLGTEDELLYLMCHGVGHGWRLLKWLCDVALCLERSDEAAVARAAARCERAGIGVVWRSTLAACGALGVAPPGAGPVEGRRAKAVAGMLPEIWRTGRWPPFWRKVSLRAALKPNVRFAGHELVRLLVVPQDWQRVNLPDRLFYLYFLIRPWLWAKDALFPAKPSSRNRS